ncbi:5032_t:CDS:2, partial [Funneliformis geosporum]
KIPYKQYENAEEKKINKIEITQQLTNQQKKKERTENIELNFANKAEKRAVSLYCDAYIKDTKISLIIDSSLAECIISLKLLKDLDMEIIQASKTIMINVNRKKRRLLGAVTKN